MSRASDRPTKTDTGRAGKRRTGLSASNSGDASFSPVDRPAQAVAQTRRVPEAVPRTRVKPSENQFQEPDHDGQADEEDDDGDDADTFEHGVLQMRGDGARGSNGSWTVPFPSRTVGFVKCLRARSDTAAVDGARVDARGMLMVRCGPRRGREGPVAAIIPLDRPGSPILSATSFDEP
ncbi:hypothetical protein GCM10011335_09340 [Aureimonas glaciei]|uniref:Uncharacterized protein n=1 Tax=Aureimonas glaciei TaxID=1776957 RepID=A0A916XTM2_9HYPH|nr:hypothetical protein GCM10011335_09340 [Aureimonas glaciei]